MVFTGSTRVPWQGMALPNGWSISGGGVLISAQA